MQSGAIENPSTDEFIVLSHFEILNNGSLQFDVELSTGDKFYDVNYQPKKGATYRTENGIVCGL